MGRSEIVSKPNKVFYLEQTGAKLRYGQKGGGLFATLLGMVGRRSIMEQQGATTQMWVADVVWRKIDDVEVE